MELAQRQEAGGGRGLQRGTTRRSGSRGQHRRRTRTMIDAGNHQRVDESGRRGIRKLTGVEEVHHAENGTAPISSEMS